MAMLENDMSEKELVKYKRETVGFVWQKSAKNLFPYLTAAQNVEVPMEFSGGEQQRVAIAIALANNPKLLLADEPTGAVDQKTSLMIQDMFRSLNRELGLTIVIVTHDISLSQKVDRVVMIRDGKISSERVMKQDYVERLKHLDSIDAKEETQEEFAILDRAGRIQLTKDILQQAGIKGNRVKLEAKDGKIIITQ